MLVLEVCAAYAEGLCCSCGGWALVLEVLKACAVVESCAGGCAEGAGCCAHGAGGCNEGAGGCARCAGGSDLSAVCAMGAGGHALHAVLCAALHAAPYAAPYAALYSGGRGG